MSTDDQNDDTRRDFLFIATGAAGVVATGAAALPLVSQMAPAADTRAASTKRVDVSGLEVGEQISVIFLGKPVFVRRRTAEEINEATAVDVSALPDQDARNPNLEGGADAADANRALDEAGEWLVMTGVCTHLGCVPVGNAGNFNGWFCPCHGSHYDTSGRIRQGPAPENMAIPVVRFEDENTLLLGEEQS